MKITRWFNACFAGSLCWFALDAPAFASPPVTVSAVVETSAALYFQPVGFPGVVWYFPRSELVLEREPNQPASSSFFNAWVRLQVASAVDPGTLDPGWAFASLVPYIIRPTTECTLQRTPEMRFVQELVHARGRDVSGGNAGPVCRFSFRLARPMPDGAMAALEEQTEQGKLITHDLPLTLRKVSSLAWSVFHAAVKDAAAAYPEPMLTPSEAQAAIETGLGSAELAELDGVMSDDEKAALRTTLLDGLFVQQASGLSLLDAAPGGDVTYHAELMSYSL